MGVLSTHPHHFDRGDAVLSSKLSVGIHMMTIFAMKPGESLTSEFIAGSVNTNPVVIRRLLGLLRDAGIVESRTGVCGGWSLLLAPERITLLDILRAVEPHNQIFALHRSEPSPDCPCGLHIQGVLTEVYDKVQEGMTRQLQSINIACITGRIRDRMAGAGLVDPAHPPEKVGGESTAHGVEAGC
ncbi:Rrf2 family transcriptional regulator [Tundrisphaera lichenicola]|uniref:Rrf2 family transcriptional regulator n=1 Tax=Tundrisphaera lichenicola TaxID=2029860 RepID=UPI003EBBE07F